MIKAHQFVICDAEKENLAAVLNGLEKAIQTARAMMSYDLHHHNHPFPLKFDYGYDLVLGDYGIDIGILKPKTEGSGDKANPAA